MDNSTKLSLLSIIISLLAYSSITNTDAVREGCNRNNLGIRNQIFLLDDRIKVGELGAAGQFSPGVRVYYAQQLPQYKKRRSEVAVIDCASQYKYLGLFK